MADQTKAKNSWWQMLLIYPTLLIAVITAAPDWMDSIQAWRQDIDKDKFPRAQKQNEFILSGLAQQMPCLSAPQMFHINPDGLQIDATMCKTGDIVFRTYNPAKAEAERVAMNVIFVEDVLGEPVDRRRAALGFGAAYASEIEEFFNVRTPATFGTKTAQSLEIVVCQEVQSDNRTVKRHVKRGNQCFDEFWDTLTGSISGRQEVACRTSC